MRKMTQKTLTIKDVIKGNTFYYITFKENDYTVRLNKKEISCSCKNGSNFGCRNSQVCVHKCLAYYHIMFAKTSIIRGSEQHELMKKFIEDVYNNTYQRTKERGFEKES